MLMLTSPRADYYADFGPSKRKRKRGADADADGEGDMDVDDGQATKRRRDMGMDVDADRASTTPHSPSTAPSIRASPPKFTAPLPRYGGGGGGSRALKRNGTAEHFRLPPNANMNTATSASAPPRGFSSSSTPHPSAGLSLSFSSGQGKESPWLRFKKDGNKLADLARFLESEGFRIPEDQDGFDGSVRMYQLAKKLGYVDGDGPRNGEGGSGWA
jgi:hypothetical protein